MTEVDTSIYKIAPTPIDPLKMLQNYAGAAHQLGENKLQLQQIRGREALGKIISESMNEDGSPNPAEILRKASQDPDASWMVLQIQEEAKNANPLTGYMGKDEKGNPQRRMAPYNQVAGMNNPNMQVRPNPLTPNAPPMRAPAREGNPLTGDAQVAPVEQNMSPEMVDKLHKHNTAMLGKIETLMNDPELDHKKVIRTVSDIVADPDTDFDAKAGAVALTQIPFGPGGTPPNADQIREKLTPVYQQLRAQQEYLTQNHPSSTMRAREVAAQLAAQQQQSPQEVVLDDTQAQLPPTPQGSPGVAAEPPLGYEANLAKTQEHYHDVLSAADSVPVENAALTNIYNLSKKGAESGTIIGEMKKWLAHKGIATEGAQNAAEMLQLMNKHADQLGLADGMPGTNEKLNTLLNSKVTDKDLPNVIQEMIPYLKAVNNMKVAQAKFYHKVDPGGQTPEKISEARAIWQENMDPRIFELQELQKDPEALKKFMKSLGGKSGQEELLKKYKAAKQNGIL